MRSLMMVLLVSAFGCDAVEDLDNFDVEIKDQVVIPGATAVETLLGGFPVVGGFTGLDLSQSATFEEKGYSPSDVDSLTLERFTLRTASPVSQDLAFLGSMVIYVEAPDLPRIEIARRDEFPAGETEIDFDTTDKSLENYLLGTEAEITVESSGGRRPPQETTIDLIVVFDVDVNVI